MARIGGGASVSEALRLEGNPVNETTVRQWMRATPEDDSRRRGRRMRLGKVTEDHFAILMNWLHQKTRRTYKKMADYLFEEVQHAYTATQIFGALKRRHITRKKINVNQLQRDENYRRSFRFRFRSSHLGCFLASIHKILHKRLDKFLYLHICFE